MVWAVDEGFSVQGLGLMASSFNCRVVPRSTSPSCLKMHIVVSESDTSRERWVGWNRA